MEGSFDLHASGPVPSTHQAYAPTMNALFEPFFVGMPSVGSEITRRNPDVEIMAMTLNDTPLNMEGYNTLDGGRG